MQSGASAKPGACKIEADEAEPEPEADAAARPECARCIKYGAECVYPAKKRFDPGSINDSLSRRHRKASSNLPKAEVDPSGPGFGESSTASALAQLPLSLSGVIDPAFDSLADISLNGHMIGQANGHGNGHANGSHPQTPLNAAPGSTPSAPAPTQMPLGIFDVDELMAFFKQTQMGAFFRQRVDPPDFLRPAFPDPDELRCVGLSPAHRTPSWCRHMSTGLRVRETR